MPLYKAEAINLRTINIGEADKLVTLFSRQYGKIKAVAKGARRTKSKFGGRLEVFTYNQLLLATGKQLDIISQCETIESFYRLREERSKLNTGAYFLRLIDLTTEERQKNEGLFELLLGSLFLLIEGADPDRLARYFEVHLTRIEGIFPDIDKLHCSKEVKMAILDLKNGDLSAEMSPSALKSIENMFKRWISEHAGRDISRLNVEVI